MQERTRAQRFGMVVGVALVVWGGWLLVLRLFGGLIEPLRAVSHLLSGVAWPLALIAFGALVLLRDRSREGSATPHARPLRRSRTNRVVSGLLGGVASYLGVGAGFVRVVYIVMSIAMGGLWGVVLYVLGTLAVPEMPPSVVVAESAPAAPPAPTTVHY